MTTALRTPVVRTLAFVGTVLVGLPLAAPLAMGLVLTPAEETPRLDLLLPGELFTVVFLGAGALLAGSVIAQRLSVAVGTLAAAAVVLFGITAWISDATGLASGVIEPSGAPLLLMIGAYALYVGAVIGLFISGVALCRATFAPSSAVRRA